MKKLLQNITTEIFKQRLQQVEIFGYLKIVIFLNWFHYLIDFFQINAFSLQLLHDYIEISAAGFFVIDRTVIYGVLNILLRTK